jgi:SAM-dependent methyltransferase
MLRRRRPEAKQAAEEEAPEPADYDWWLPHLFGDTLDELDARCAGAGPEAFALFRDLDDDLWAVLLTQEYELYPNIRALLPDVPAAELQERWNGASGLELMNQSKDFYARARDRFERHRGGLEAANVLDFGCGWGRLTRFFARDITPGSLYGCDPVEEILEVCRRTRVPARLARSEFLPERIPFDESFDLIFAFSVFTHLSESAHERSLEAIHAAMRPGGILVVTIRPPAYLRHTPLMATVLESLGPNPAAAVAGPRYLFIPHAADQDHPQYAGGEMTYGEAVITLPYVRERWTSRFDLVDVSLLASDIHQVMLTLKRREPEA